MDDPTASLALVPVARIPGGPTAAAIRLWRLSLGVMLLALAGWVAGPFLRSFGPSLWGFAPSLRGWLESHGVDREGVSGRGVDGAASAGEGMPLPGEEPAGDSVFRLAIPERGESLRPAPPEGPVRDRPPTAAPVGRPDGLPPVPGVFNAPPPAFADGYRTTLRMPPPPLLDPMDAIPRRPSERPIAAVPEQTRIDRSRLPQIHVVRDGDDLTRIAIRIYGNPAMADSILAANRDRLRDPAILPIGMRLVLPAATAGLQTAAPPQGRSGWLEPPAG